MRVSIVVPAYNEEKTVELILTKLAATPLDMEVIVVDDASTDRTWEILQRLSQQEPFSRYRFLRHERNQGKGVGLKTAFAHTTGELVTVQDADMEYDPQDLPALVQKWEEVAQTGKKTIAVYGRRNLSQQKFTTRWGNRFLTAVTNLLYGSRIHDMETCYKLMPREIAHALPMTGRRFEIEPEITSCILQAGYTIYEVPISYTPRVEKKLSPWKDGWPALAMLLSRRFSKPFRLPVTVTVASPSEKATV
ncbi:glycosyltransferase family 2 protein [Tengunoibacter tsumagoiensis]|uniref:Glycosyl transferase n=1 Tax=Tengunoibacter tsumagoiensis TaxID=2014871 RepID=A0A402A4P6_9CHLR|nr:glycosyltransferase family 2 protein [Tengunoibacter tsumagoiensis]GCE14127.1 glycosyl transferase [Tengunoibacter tsumagoiensis]